MIRKSELRKNSLAEAKQQIKPYLPEDSVNSIRNRIRVYKDVLCANNEHGSEFVKRVPILTFQDAYNLQKQKYADVRRVFKEGRPAESDLPEWKLAAEQDKYRESQVRFLKDLRSIAARSRSVKFQMSPTDSPRSKLSADSNK